MPDLSIPLINNTYSQDIIVKKNGEEIKVKTIEISNDNIKYKDFNNQDGPIRNIYTNNVFMVKYENGTKDVFIRDNKLTHLKAESVDSLRESIFNRPEFVNQKMKRGVEFRLNIKKFVNADEIVWYGWDFKHLVINDPRQADDIEEIIGLNIPQILILLDKQFPDKWIAKQFKEYNLFSSNNLEISKRNQEINPDALIQLEETTFTMQGIEDIVKSYSLTKIDGVGFVVIMESFNKPYRYVSSFLTFFDIKTREVLYTTRMKGLPGSMKGYSYYWYAGAFETMAYFFKYEYLK